MFARFFRSLLQQPDPRPPIVLTPRAVPCNLPLNLQGYAGTAFHRLSGLLVGPEKEIVAFVRFPTEVGGGYFEQDGRRFEILSLDSSKFDQVLRAFAFQHSTKNTGGWCPTRLCREDDTWTTDTPRVGGIVSTAYRCWFNCQNFQFTFQALPPGEEPRVRKAPRLLVEQNLACTPDQQNNLSCRIFDGDEMEAQLLYNKRLLRTTFIEEWEGAYPPEAPAENIEGLWLWRLHFQKKLEPLEKLGPQHFRCYFREGTTKGFGTDIFRVEIDVAKGEAQVYASGLGIRPVLRSVDGTILVQGRFRRLGGLMLVRFFRDGKALKTVHSAISSTARHSGFSHGKILEPGPWFGKEGLASDLYGLAYSEKPLVLERQSETVWSAHYRDTGSHHDIYHRDEYDFSLNVEESSLEVHSNSHVDST